MLLEVNGLTVSYGARETVKNVTLSLERGEILSIVGESGSGKTTVIRAVMGCLPGAGRVTGGTVEFDGRDVLAGSPDEWRSLRARGMSMIFQDSGNMINPIRKVGGQFVDYIRTHAPEKSAGDAVSLAMSMLASVNLPAPADIMERYPFELSGGMRQRVGIAMAMTFSPKLLLADEPTSALDVTTQAQIVRQILDVRDRYRAAVIIVTHNLGVASYMSDKIIVMKDGAAVESGSREDVIHSPRHDYTKRLLSAVPVIGGVRYGDR